jgi:hypothetical protein
LKKKLLFIWEYPFTKLHYKYFFLKYFKKIFKIKIIDCSDIFHPNTIFVRDLNLYKPKTMYEFETKNNLDQINYVILGGSENFKNKMYASLRNYKIKFIDFRIHYPVFNSITFDLLIKIIHDFRIIFFYIIIYNIILNRLKILKNYFSKSKDKIKYKVDLTFVSGDLAKEHSKNNNNLKKIIETCSYEYALKPKLIYKKKIAVFLDNLTFMHPDVLILFKKREKFYHSHFLQLNNFFSFLEKKYNLKVIIAAHPKTDLSKFKNLYPNYEIIINKTIDLVFSSQFVMAHSTTSAINFAIIYKKPLIFLTTNILENEFQYYKELVFKNIILKQPLVNVSYKENYINFDKYRDINFKGYQEFICKYMKSKYIKSTLLKEKILAEILKL